MSQLKVIKALEQPEVQEIMLSSGPFRGIRVFVANSGHDFGSHFLPPPHLGEHTGEILVRLLKFSPSAIQALFQKGVIR